MDAELDFQNSIVVQPGEESVDKLRDQCYY